MAIAVTTEEASRLRIVSSNAPRERRLWLVCFPGDFASAALFQLISSVWVFHNSLVQYGRFGAEVVYHAITLPLRYRGEHRVALSLSVCCVDRMVFT